MTTINEMLIEAADTNNTRDAIKALKKGADPNFMFDGFAAIHHVIPHENLTVLDHLIRFGANVDLITSEGFSPLQLACGMEKMGCVTRLLQASANIMFKDSNGDTALHHAAHGQFRQRNKQVTRALIKVLVQSGAAIEEKNHFEFTPLQEACAYNNAPAALELIALGANVTATTKHGTTALHLIDPRDFPDVVSALIAAGAHVNAEAERIGSPLYRATSLNAHKSALALLDAGADPEVHEQEGALEMACKNTMVAVIRKMIDKTRATIPFGEGVSAERLIDAFYAGQHPGQVIDLAQTWKASHP